MVLRETDSPKSLGGGGLFFCLVLLLSPLAKQYHSLEATHFRIRNSTGKKKKRESMFKIQKSALCVMNILYIVDSSSSQTESELQTRHAVLRISYSIVQNDKFRSYTLVHYYFPYQRARKE